jgi:tetratricopeptide (TPR) repeat protein
MQNIFSKNSIILFFVLLVSSNQLFANIEIELNKADSLYKNKQFSEALIIYSNLLENQGVFSESSLLKSAFICEQQKRYVEAIYYLFLYYKEKPQKTVLAKISSIASTQNYSGYNFTDLDIFYAYIHKYYENISVFLSFLCLVLSLSVIYTRYKKGSISGSRKFVVLLLFMLCLLFVNYFTEIKFGIVNSDNCLVMDSPSAGGKLIGYKNKGERVRINSEIDIWAQVSNSDTAKYIRKTKLYIY